MKIDYVVISADDSHYLDFYEIVSSTWNKFGLKTMMFHITDHETDFIENKYGLYKYVKKSNFFPSSWQSQLIRLYSYKYFDNYNLLLSDIDMIPLQKEYFIENAEKISDEQILNFSNQPYPDVPYFAICYILSNSKIMKQILNLEDTFENFLKKVEKSCGVKWNTDENYLYNSINNYINLISLPKRNYFLDRIDRGDWFYDLDKLKNKNYIDSHLLRPYKKYKEEIDTLIKDLD